MVQLQRLVVAPSQLSQSQCVLTAEQQHYLSRVLRLRAGDRFIVMNGQGQWWLAALTEQPAQARILEAIAVETELPLAVTLAVALPKGNGMDEVVRQATELGVASIVPILSDRTLLNPSPQKIDRWRRIAQEAAEQSERQVVPEIAEALPFTAYLQGSANGSELPPIRYICVARGSVPLLSGELSHHAEIKAATSMVIATGPEGGWTEPEVEAAIAVGYHPVSLGRRILRAVTAPIVALAIVSATVEA
ncbi:16S rRNA (uracil(1498)-N(3))-methyltransferase [Oculatella sp. LEGE 06141]|uniref:16S rRNA (uracil(1498)-N(3))-methyltransferase n=1 Tax=Oculatella sp. LEGE 06141 TaxID=1828648 RepID=UPI001880B92A|nr:16S rRNA (uracil(1498)-N(3))-methyltransferase [Oculatella sp. LEGE 06141]MBE9178432.1 16S rRNA (uracil(1498)-N(3))-methyltransferase [Oculatella sp. LEGE 06141]